MVDVIGEGGVVALDAGLAQAFEHVKNRLELEKHRGRCIAFQLQAA